ncbi:hypothetical protein MMC07_001764 [Pseudocyphellaria aurata]|nr:hypothetical protein [Pseudocyphellaria aurata]
MPTTDAIGLTIPYATPGEIYAASILLPLLGITFVLLRFHTRTLQKMSTGVDDCLMLPALILVIGMGICLIIGLHRKAIAYTVPINKDLSPEEQLTHVDPTLKIFNQIQYVFMILMVLAFGIIKLSITFYYRRFFVIAMGSVFDWITRAAVGIVVLWTTGCLFGFIFSCGKHISSNWGSSLDYVSYCGPSEVVHNAFVVSDLITDVMVLFLPLPVIWSLQMTTGKKIIVTCILATGAVSVIASIIKAVIAFEMLNATSSTVNPYLAAATLLYWSMIEGGMAVIATCLPTLRFLVRNVSVSGIFHKTRRALNLGPIHTHAQRNMHQRSPRDRQASHTHLYPGSSTASTCSFRESDSPA